MPSKDTPEDAVDWAADVLGQPMVERGPDGFLRGVVEHGEEPEDSSDLTRSDTGLASEEATGGQKQ
jgi:hypothetical protein